METRQIYLTGLAAEAEGALLAAVADLHLDRIGPPAAPDGRTPHVPFAVVGLDGAPDQAFSTVARLSAAGTRVAVVGPSQDPDLILRAMRAGAREFAVVGDPRRLEHAVRSLVRPALGVAGGTVTAVFPAKGGMGATTVAINVAAALAGGGHRACVVDLDLQLGDVTAFLDVRGGYTIADVVANARRLDRNLLDASVVAHASGVRVLAHGERLEEAERVDAPATTRLLGFLREHYAHVILDGLRAFDEVALAGLDAADRILLVVTQEVPAVRNAQRCVEIFRRLSYPDDKVTLVVNRHLRSSQITPEVIAETVGLPVSACLPNDFAAATRAVQRGSTLVQDQPRSAIARELSGLARQLTGEPDAAGRGGLIRRVFGRR